MSNQPIPAPLPTPDDEREEATGLPTREVDGDEMLDPDAADETVDSAEADRLASGADRGA